MYKLQAKRRALKKRPPFYCFIKGNLQENDLSIKKDNITKACALLPRRECTVIIFGYILKHSVYPRADGRPPGTSGKRP